MTVFVTLLLNPDSTPQAVRVEHMDSDDLWELQAGRRHSPALPLHASHVLAKRAGLGRAAWSVRQRARCGGRLTLVGRPQLRSRHRCCTKPCLAIGHAEQVRACLAWCLRVSISRAQDAA